jgi:hypothetical protein
VKAGGKQSRAHAGFLHSLFLNPEDGGDVPPKCLLTFNGLHGVISQKIELFITTAVRTSNQFGLYINCKFLDDYFQMP